MATTLTETFAHFRRSANLPATGHGVMRHSSDYLRMCLGLTEGVETATAADLVKRFTSKPATYSNTDTGAAALQFEALVLDKFSNVAHKFVETVVEATADEFMAVFQGTIDDSVLDRLKLALRDVCELSVVVKCGARSDDMTEIAEVTILRCKPIKKKDSKATEPVVKTQAKPAPDPIDVALTQENYMRVVSEGGLSDAAMAGLHEDNEVYGAKVYTDKAGTQWAVSEDDGRWYPQVDEGAGKDSVAELRLRITDVTYGATVDVAKFKLDGKPKTLRWTKRNLAAAGRKAIMPLTGFSKEDSTIVARALLGADQNESVNEGAGRTITLPYLEKLIADNNKEYGTNFRIDQANNAYELWSGDYRLESGSKKDCYEMFVKVRFSERYAGKDESVDEADAAPIFDADSAVDALGKIKAGIKAPYVNGQASTLGGKDRPTILFVVSLDERETWANKIMENSRYFRMHLYPDGTLEQFAYGLKNYKDASAPVPKKFRKAKVKSIEDAIAKVNAYIADVEKTGKSESTDEAIVGYDAWEEANEGTGKLPWFVVRKKEQDYLRGAGGNIVRFASAKAAARAAVTQNKKDGLDTQRWTQQAANESADESIASDYGTWRIAQDDEHPRRLLVTTVDGTFAAEGDLGEAQELIDGIDKIYDDLPAERDLMIEAVLREWAQDNGVLLVHRDNQLIESSHDDYTRRDNEVRMNCTLRKTALDEGKRVGDLAMPYHGGTVNVQMSPDRQKLLADVKAAGMDFDKLKKLLGDAFPKFAQGRAGGQDVVKALVNAMGWADESVTQCNSMDERVSSIMGGRSGTGITTAKVFPRHTRRRRTALRRAASMESVDEAKEYVIWGIPKDGDSEMLLVSEKVGLKSMEQAQATIKKLESQYGCTKCRVVVVGAGEAGATAGGWGQDVSVGVRGQRSGERVAAVRSLLQAARLGDDAV